MRRAPGLAVVLVGDNPASQIYVRSKVKACRDLGIRGFQHTPPASVTTAELLALIAQGLNHNENVDGILVQMPLPKQWMHSGYCSRSIPRKMPMDSIHLM